VPAFGASSRGRGFDAAPRQDRHARAADLGGAALTRRHAPGGFQRPREGAERGGEVRVSPAARTEAQRILDAAARRLLAARLEGQALNATAGSDADALENGTDECAALVEREKAPILSGVENEGAVKGA
jgi:hypothetical protein